MSTYKMRQSNIDASVPIVKKTFIVRTTCDVCRQITALKIEATGNRYAILAGELHGKCANKKCKKPIQFVFTQNMPGS